MEGWLLDVYPTDKDEMVLCLKGKDGKTRLFKDEYTPELYIYGSSKKLENLENELDERNPVERWTYEKKRVQPGDLDKSDVIRVECCSMKNHRGLARSIAKFGNYRDFELYNVDVPYSQDYLHEKNLFPLAKVGLKNPIGPNFQLLDSATSTNYELPPLKIARLKIYSKRSGPSPQFDNPIDKIIINMDEGETEIEGLDEREKILKLVNIVRDKDPDIILTEGGDSWDLPYLAQRAKANNIIERVILDRKPKPFEETSSEGTSFSSYGQVYYKPPPHYLKGRIHIDTKNSFIHEKCELQGLVELARMTRTPLQKTARSSIGSAMTNLQLYWARKNDILIPWKKSEPEDFKTASKLLKADRGGFIHKPEIGIHEDVGEIDFSSFYPKMMEKYNISPETILCNCCPNSEKRVPNLDYNICEKRRGLIPKVLKPILKKREEYKKQINENSEKTPRKNYDKRQKALKWILVTCFGYLGYRNAKFGKIEAHETVTAFARKNLKKASHIAEKEGFKIVHGIVDSLWVKKTNVTKHELKSLCKKIENKIGLPIGLEGKCQWVVFPAERGEGQMPVTNRYYGLFEGGGLKARGILARRRDTPNLICRAQRKMLEKLSEANNRGEFLEKIEESIEVLRDYMIKIGRGMANLKDLAITRKLSKKPDSYQANARSAVAAKQLQRAGMNLHPGQQVKYIVTDAGAENPNLRVKPLQLINREKYDQEWYKKRLISSAEELLNPFDYDKDKIRKHLFQGKKQKKLNNF